MGQDQAFFQSRPGGLILFLVEFFRDFFLSMQLCPKIRLQKREKAKNKVFTPLPCQVSPQQLNMNRHQHILQ